MKGFIHKSFVARIGLGKCFPVFLFLLFAGAGHAQSVFTTNRPPALRATAPTVNHSELFSHLPAGLALTNRINIYSIDAARHVITNTIDPAASASQISLATNQIHFIAVPGAALEVTLGKSRTLMPLKIGVPQSTGNTTTLAWKDLFFVADQIPLTWDSAKHAYTTTIAIGVDSDSDTSAADFPVPVTLALSSTYCKVDTFDVSVKHAGPPYVHVGLTSTDITTTNGTVTVHCPTIPDITLDIPKVVETGWLHILSLPLLVAALIGSLLGGFTRIIAHRRKGQPLKWIWLLHGLLVAIIIVSAASIGIAVFAVPASVASTQTGAFVIAALCGYYGTVVLSWLKKSVIKS